MAKDHSTSSVDRPGPSIRFIGKIIIFVEGKNTESSYFKLLKLSNCQIEPVIVKGNGIARCLDFVDESSKRYMRMPKSQRDKFKQKWLVFDYDGRDDFAEAIAKARKENFGVAFSSMCIEYWFLLHFEDNDGQSIPMCGSSHSKSQIDRINKYIKRYNQSKTVGVIPYYSKNKIVGEDFFDLMLAVNPNTHNRRIIDAFIRARKIHQEKKHNGAEFQESVTTIYELLIELGVIKPGDKPELKEY